MPEFTVGLSSRYRDEIVPAEDLHLPRAGTGELRPPQHAGLAILERDEGEKSTHRHRADLAKSFARDAVTDPRTLELQILDALRVKAAFGTPGRTIAMHGQTVRRVVMSVRRHATERKTAEHFKGHWFLAGIANAHATGKNRHIPLPGKVMLAAQARGVLERGDDAGAAVLFLNLLTDEFENGRRVPRAHRASL